jgi:hypothetical protein
MGLDMYLYKKIYINKNREEEQIGYWRKSNAIHMWFVDNVQNGVDECQETLVDRDKLKELLDICEEVKGHPERAPELLPTQSGFFFGGTEYDDWYFEDIDNTIKILKNAIKATYNKNTEIYYCSSW